MQILLAINWSINAITLSTHFLSTNKHSIGVAWFSLSKNTKITNIGFSCVRFMSLLVLLYSSKCHYYRMQRINKILIFIINFK
jgi:hypothetical protein